MVLLSVIPVASSVRVTSMAAKTFRSCSEDVALRAENEKPNSVFFKVERTPLGSRTHLGNKKRKNETTAWIHEPWESVRVRVVWRGHLPVGHYVQGRRICITLAFGATGSSADWVTCMLLRLERISGIMLDLLHWFTTARALLISLFPMQSGTVIAEDM